MATATEPRPVLSEAATSSPGEPGATNPEFDLLVACCTHPFDLDRTRELLSRPLQWERMLALVDHHRVLPQVYGALSRLSHLVPGQQLSALQMRYRDNARKTLWFTRELIRILNHLESAGIKALPYKGPVLAEILYGEVTERQFGDLDVLILPTDVPKAKAALLGLGYTPSLKFPPRIEQAYIETGYECSFSSAHHANLLELQWRILPRFYSIELDVAELFDRAAEISTRDVATQPPLKTWKDAACNGHETLRSEDLMLVLCVHAAKHAWVQLSWLCDIAQLARSQHLDWNAIQGEAARLGIERIVCLNLLLAQKLLGTPLPPQIHTSLRCDRSTKILADEILCIIERSTYYNTESVPYFRLMMRLRERWQDRARFLWRLTFTPSLGEWSAVRLPKALQPVYRLVRLSRLGKRLASTS